MYVTHEWLVMEQNWKRVECTESKLLRQGDAIEFSGKIKSLYKSRFSVMLTVMYIKDETAPTAA